MGLRPPSVSFSCTSASPRHALHTLLLCLLLTTLMPPTSGETGRAGGKKFVELRCLCLTTVSGIHPSRIQNLSVIRAAAHCAQVEVLATLTDGKKVCLDPEAPLIKKIVQKYLEGDRPVN
ncbi:platelet basic protein [Sorex fumeus]|uniref:platelet basic protein n=1 Tax=Sorex fumeus TaxID=62283 RepID=UPI0024AE01A9|nr:platelet basic protein [Sorex fumeus]